MLWQSGASESATVCFVISLSICYWLFKCRVLRIVCVCVWERGRHGHTTAACVCERERACVCVCVCVRERERERQTVTSQRSVQPVRNRLNCGLFANTYELHHCVCHATLFLTVFILKAEAHDYGKGRYISYSCLWCSANHNALCQLANQSRLRMLEGGAL